MAGPGTPTAGCIRTGNTYVAACTGCRARAPTEPADGTRRARALAIALGWRCVKARVITSGGAQTNVWRVWCPSCQASPQARGDGSR